MASTRARFTVSYVLLSMGAVIVFAIAIWSARLAVARDQLIADGQSFGDRLIIQLRNARGLYPLLVIDSSRGVPQPSRELAALLDAQPEYFILIGRNDQILYNSVLIRMLAPSDAGSLLQYAIRLPADQAVRVPITADPTNVHALSMRSRAAGPGLEPDISRVVVCIPARESELAGQLLTGTIDRK